MNIFRPLILAWNSGAGKDLFAEELSKKDTDFVVSKARVTTRAPRENETSMTFVDRATFETREKTGQIIGAYTGIGDERYGIDTHILTQELQTHHPILPFGGDTLDIQEKYLMDLAWFCRKHRYPIPLYFLLHREDKSAQELAILKRNLWVRETQTRLKRMDNPNNQLVRWAIIRHYAWLAQVSNLEDDIGFSLEQLSWLWKTLHRNLGDKTTFFKQRHERP